MMKKHHRAACILAGLTMGLAAMAQAPNNTGTYYKNADGKTGAALKSALSQCIYNRTERSYGDLWTDFEKTDKRSDGKVWDMYSGTNNFEFGVNQDRGSGGGSEGQYYNREHSFPKAWFGGKVPPMYTDLHHMYPTDKLINNKRSDNPFSEVDKVTWQSNGGFSKLGSSKTPGYSGVVFEPNDQYKGDFARTYFYMVTCYDEKLPDWYSEMLDGTQYPGLAKWALDMLMRWAKNDPVSQKEIDRNNAVYDIQNNRNPFIDYPGLEDYIWGNKVGQAFHYDNYDAGLNNMAAQKTVKKGSTYNIKGQRMRSNRNLRRGVYVRNKKKVVVK